MKRIKLSFAAIIALIAVCTTLAVQAGAFNSTSLALVDPYEGCFQNVVAANQIPPCDDEPLTTPICVTKVDDATEADPILPCEPSSIFCCVLVESVPTTTCPSGFAITEVKCGIFQPLEN